MMQWLRRKLIAWYHRACLRLFQRTVFISSTATEHALVVLRVYSDGVLYQDHVSATHAQFEVIVDSILNEEWKTVTFTVEPPGGSTYRTGLSLFQLDAWAKRQLQRKARQMKHTYARQKFLVDTSTVRR